MLHQFCVFLSLPAIHASRLHSWTWHLDVHSCLARCGELVAPLNICDPSFVILCAVCLSPRLSHAVCASALISKRLDGNPNDHEPASVPCRIPLQCKHM